MTPFPFHVGPDDNLRRARAMGANNVVAILRRLDA
jgi:hypothetical protein